MANYALATFLLLFALVAFGIGIPEVLLGVVALIAGILVLIGK